MKLHYNVAFVIVRKFSFTRIFVRHHFKTTVTKSSGGIYESTEFTQMEAVHDDTDIAPSVLQETRPLASIVRIKDLIPISGADRICIAKVKGWQCIVAVTDFAVGDLAVYFSIDSIPDFSDPNIPESVRRRGGHIKTIKLKGVISQGLLGPLAWLAARGHDISTVSEGDDVTGRMGVTKYIAPDEIEQYAVPDGVSRRGGGNKPFPAFIPKTDQKRLQDDPQFLDYLVGRNVVITRKEDGCSATYFFNNGTFAVCGRNYEWGLESTSNYHYFRMAEKFNLRAKLTSLGLNIALQGEIVGPKVNGNKMKQTELDFRVFDVFNITEQRYLFWDEVVSLCKDLDLRTVPEVFKGHSADLSLTVEDFIGLAEAQEYKPGVLAEGIVVKLNDCDCGYNLSFKVISNKYLLKHNM
jgi:RNA ligase (TIGR02306 family)